MPNSKPLAGKVAVVAGATRHSGRGVAIELGLAGATVYCTGRSARGNPSPRKGPETIEQTSELVEALGGAAIAVRVDHTDIGQVEGLFQKVIEEQGRLDVVVNCICGLAGNDPFLASNLAANLRGIVEGGSAHIATAHIATAQIGARAMADAGAGGLIIGVTDHEWDTFYAMEKALINRIPIAVAEELRGHGIAILFLLPGAFFRCFDIMTEEALRRAIHADPSVAKCHTPRLIGRAVVALAADPSVIKKTGRLIDLKDLVAEYGLTDLDGRTTGEMW